MVLLLHYPGPSKNSTSSAYAEECKYRISLGGNMFTRLKDRVHYEELYDRITIELCRDKEEILRNIYKESKEKGFPEVEGKDSELEAARVFNIIHYFEVDLLAGERWEERSKTIQEWIDRDTAKDQMVSEARLYTEPICVHCGKTGLRIIDKDLHHRGSDYEHEEVLFTLECAACNKRTAVWQDGTLWEQMSTPCPKCSQTMSETSRRAKYSVTTTYTCPNCQHTYKDKLDLRVKQEEEHDPYWEEDKARFLLTNEKVQEYLKGKQNLERLAEWGKKHKEREANKELYEAVAQIKKVNIGQLDSVLKPSIEKAGYTELTFDKPEINKDVYIGFSCLDGKPERVEYDSRKELKKVIESALSETNWRLMSDGISYRLGYLSGRVRAYEREDELLGLVNKKHAKKTKRTVPIGEISETTLKGHDGRNIIL